MQALEIGVDDFLRWDEVDPSYVRAQGSSSTAPMLLLLGCNTAAADIGYQDFIAEFRKSGAAVVVGTITYVLGQQAAPVAGALVRQLKLTPRQGKITLGEAMRNMRCEMLRQGNMMSLLDSDINMKAFAVGRHFLLKMHSRRHRAAHNPRRV